MESEPKLPSPESLQFDYYSVGPGNAFGEEGTVKVGHAREMKYDMVETLKAWNVNAIEVSAVTEYPLEGITEVEYRNGKKEKRSTKNGDILTQEELEKK